MANNIPISEKSKSIIYDYPLIKKRTDMAYTELRKYTDDWQKFQQVWAYNYTVRDLLKTGANVSYYVFESSAERKSYKAGQASHVSMYAGDAAKGVFNDIQHTIPDTPVFTSLAGGDASVTLTWAVPVSNESPLISYTISAYDASNNGISKLVTASTASPTLPTLPTLPNTFKFTGLVNGISYRFTIYSTNDIGNSYTSAFTNVVIPTTIPEQPTAFVVFQENNYFTTQWLVPANGGSAITSYLLTLCDASNNILRDVSNNILRDASNNILRDASNNILRDVSNNIIQNIINDTGVLNTKQGILIVTGVAGVQVPYTIVNPIASNLVIGNYYSFKLLARNAAGDSLITTLAAPVRFIKIPAQAPLWVAGSDITYDATADRLTFKFTQTADDRNMTTSYTFSSIPVAIERSLTVQNTTTTNLGGAIQVVASIVGIPDNTYTFTVYAYNVATRVADYRISLNSSPIIVSKV
jgi:hypothetical protein